MLVISQTRSNGVYAKEIPLEVIEYGNPDNDAEAGDLKGHNQVYLRCELYLGVGVSLTVLLSQE